MPVDWEDHQTRPEPHALLAQTAQLVPVPSSPATLDVTVGTMKAYRSARVTITTRADAVDVTAYWSFEGSAGTQWVSETQQAPALSVSSLLFRSQGHTLEQVSFASIGPGALIDYDIAGSNLDPLPASAADALDAWAPHQVADLFAFDVNGVDWVGPLAATVDALCLHNGYVATSGAQNDFIDLRFSLGPIGALWGFNLMYLTGPDYGEIFGYLGTPSEDAPASGEPDPTNLLTQIDAADGDFSYVLAFKVTCYSAALTRNKKATVGAAATGFNPYAVTGDFRIGGDVGAKLTTFAIPAGSGLVNGDGGPGVYALRLVAGAKVGISTGYKIALQSVSAQRHDWSWA